MAESPNPTPAPATPVPAAAAPAEAAAAPQPAPAPKGPGAVGRMLKSFVSTTTWLILGVALLLFAILVRKYGKHFIPVPFDRIQHLPYFIAGLGLMLLGQARGMVQRDYLAEHRKNRQSPHAWKIPLVGAQVAMLYLAGVYGFLVGFQVVPPIQSLVGLFIVLLFFLGYVLWYVIAEMTNRLPSLAGLRVALLAVGLGAASFIVWTFFQMVFVALVLGFYALIAAITSLLLSRSRALGLHGEWLNILLLTATVCMVSVVGYYSIPYGKPRANLVELGLAQPLAEGNPTALDYSQDGKKIAFCVKTGGGYFVQVVSAVNESLPTFRVPGGEAACHPLFVDGGKFLMVDAVKGGERGLWKVNAATGKTTILRNRGVQPFGDGTPWAEKTGRFLYVAHSGDRYQLDSLDLAKGRSKRLLDSTRPILTPSWTFAGNIAYADGSHGLFYVADPTGRNAAPLVSANEQPDLSHLLKSDPVVEVLPAPDGFRYLYVTHKKKDTAIWAVLTDGSKRKKLYETNGEIHRLSWLPDGQKVVFQKRSRKFGFLIASTGIQLLDANLSTVVSLIPPQFSDHSPAVSPDGVKVAFAASQGLWYSSVGKSGIWVALLR